MISEENNYLLNRKNNGLQFLKSKRSYSFETYYFFVFIIDTSMKLRKSAAYMFYRSSRLPHISIRISPAGSTSRIKATNYSLTFDIFSLAFRKYPKDKNFLFLNKFLLRNVSKNTLDYKNIKMNFNKKYYIYNFFYFFLHFYIPRVANLAFEHSIDRPFGCLAVFPNYSLYDISNYYSDGFYSSSMRSLGLFSYISRSNIYLKLRLDYSILENLVILSSSELRNYAAYLEVILTDRSGDNQLFRFQRSFFKFFVLDEDEEEASFR